MRAMKTWKRPMTRWLAALGLAVLLLAPAAAARADNGYWGSGNQNAYFWYCGGVDCVPLVYSWHGGVYIDYTWNGYDSEYTLHYVDQSVTMLNSANSPCSIGLGISTDAYKASGAFIGTIYVQQPGSYAYGANDRNWGGYAWPEWGARSLRANASDSTWNCTGGDSFSFDVGP